ncbi:hypothetical protein [Fundidesulfovibrio terrae]|uniref:hypothetical protein n=1 Tax=Fundidesulfovibrio terrae TaxID=2922866 RepID=UPI001FAE857A|nr:hypothetical protein [Fundidesulfovibrio terrae]
MPVRPLAWVLAAFILCSVQLFPLPAAAQDQPSGKAEPAPDKPVGKVTMEFGQGGFIVSASGGQGALLFKGRKYPFKLGSLGVGGFGVSKVKATGEVFNLKRIEDFPGGYFQARAGYAAGEGKGVLRLENANGVVLKLRVIAKGLALQLGADGLKIEMGKGSKK